MNRYRLERFYDDKQSLFLVGASLFGYCQGVHWLVYQMSIILDNIHKIGVRNLKV
jgi:hypothetical protein